MLISSGPKFHKEAQCTYISLHPLPFRLPCNTGKVSVLYSSLYLVIHLNAILSTCQSQPPNIPFPIVPPGNYKFNLCVCESVSLFIKSSFVSFHFYISLYKVCHTIFLLYLTHFLYMTISRFHLCCS